MKKIYLILLCIIPAFKGNAQQIPNWKIEDVVKYYSKTNDSIYVINFWATFCKPCINEIPYLESISKKYASQKVTLLLVSLDLPAFYPENIRDFANKNNYTSAIAWLNETDVNHFCPVISKKWRGSIPATIIVNAASGYRFFIESAMTADRFEKELVKAIGNK